MENMEKLEKIVDKFNTIDELSTKVEDITKELVSLKTVAKESTKTSEEIVKNYSVALMKSLKHKEMNKDYAIGTDSDGGYFIPEVVANIYGNLAGKYGVARQISTPYSMTQDVVKFPKADDTTAGVIAEGASMSTNSSTISIATLTAVKIGNIVKQSVEFGNDARPEDLNFLMQRALGGITNAEDKQLFIADGTSTYGNYTGLMNNTSINKHIMTSTGIDNFTLDDVSKMISSVGSRYQAVGCFVFNPYVRGILRAITTTGAGYEFKPSGSDVDTLWGYPVYYTDVLPGAAYSAGVSTTFGVFGDFSQVVMGIKDSMTIKLLDQLYAGTDEVGYQFKERVGFTILDDNAFCTVSTAAA